MIEIFDVAVCGGDKVQLEENFKDWRDPMCTLLNSDHEALQKKCHEYLERWK